MRTRSWGSDGARVYLPGYEHRTDTGETKVYIGDYAVVSRTGATRKVEYLLKDRLGSVDAVANASGSVIETRGYDAFGKPRSGTWGDLTPAKIASTAVTPKGFTQHEHLNQLELIHMNGRAYDYNLGRFTGVDPFIQFPLNSQSLNPYSYILNNPLSGTDPTGYLAATGSHIVGSDVGDTGARLSYQAQPQAISGKQSGDSGAPERTAPSGSGGSGPANNGAQAKPTPTGTDKRDSEVTQPDKKGTASNTNISGADNNWTENDGQLSGDDGGSEEGARKTIPREEMMSSGFGSPNIEDYDTEDPLFHEYTFETPLCRIASTGCTGASVLRFGDGWSAPTTTPPVKQGRNELWGYPLTGKTNPVFHSSGIDEAGNAYFFNMTLRGHNYHAGVVASNTYARNGTFYLKTHGFGYSSNLYFKAENYMVGYAYFFVLAKLCQKAYANSHKGGFSRWRPITLNCFFRWRWQVFSSCLVALMVMECCQLNGRQRWRQKVTTAFLSQDPL